LIINPGGGSFRRSMNRPVSANINKNMDNSMEIISKKIPQSQLKSDFMHFFTSIIKADVDIERRIIAVDAELHADLESLLLENGSLQENVWGINLHPYKEKDEFIEFTSLINIRPSMNNNSMEIEDKNIKITIHEIIEELIDFGA
jgi:hypothetical protein